MPCARSRVENPVTRSLTDFLVCRPARARFRIEDFGPAEGGFILKLPAESGNTLTYAAQLKGEGRVCRVAIHHLD
jgi:hypothetical protein